MDASRDLSHTRTISDEHDGSRRAILRSLRYRDFRLMWLALIVSSLGTWMQIVTLGLLVLDLTHGSAALLGTVSLAQAISFLIWAPMLDSPQFFLHENTRLLESRVLSLYPATSSSYRRISR